MTRSIAKSLTWVLLICFAAPQLSAQCLTLSIQQPERLKPGKSLTIRLLPIDIRASDATIRYQYRAESLEDVRTLLGLKLRQELQSSGLFSSVVLSDGDATPRTDLVLETTITEIVQGTTVIPVPITPVGEPTRVGLAGTLAMRDSGLSVLDFVCDNSTYGAPFVKRPKAWMHHNVDLIGRDLRKELVKATAYANVPQTKDQPSIQASRAISSEIGATIYSLAFPPTEWRRISEANRKGLASAQSRNPSLMGVSIPALSAASKPATDGTVAALWITRFNIRDLRYLEAQKRNQLRLLSRKTGSTPSLPAEDPLLADAGAVYKQVGEGDLLVLQLWFAKQGPTIWEIEKMRSVTTLRNLAQGSDYARPSLVVNSIPYLSTLVSGHEWVYNSVEFVFPARRADGKAVVENPTDPLEIRTELDRREVVIRVNN